MLIEIPPKISVSSFMGFLKGKSSLIIHERHANLKYKHGNRSFWCRGYYIDTAGKNTKKIAEYIKNQLEEDKLQDQLTFREYEDPFKGSNNNPLKMSDRYAIAMAASIRGLYPHKQNHRLSRWFFIISV